MSDRDLLILLTVVLVVVVVVYTAASMLWSARAEARASLAKAG